MEHEVFVPVAAERLRAVLDDPARVARAVPGLQQDAGAGPLAGRLKIRVGGHSVTYRGALRLTGREAGAYAVEGDASEARGTGSVKFALRLRLRDAAGGTDLAFDGSAGADGRITQFPADAVEAAVSRLLNRFAENLADAAREAGPGAEDEPEAETDDYLAAGDFEPRATDDFDTTPDADDSPVPPPGDGRQASPPGGDGGGDSAPAAAAAGEHAAGEDATEDAAGEDVTEDAAGEDAVEDAARRGDPVAEAAHARRTMIGRSAEEVDHAPPRGRYAPVPAPQTVSPPTSLRWAAPAAALALASAIVAVRALRRRR
ncbi:SRPBCC domain-containing protein [Streptomyces sp. NPDC085946]|uniref:SRPBCC domain-containing protein n=1 Tax=Streptomyces sp. NPDC085946 TaxID=3365744 RepID=UPI0037D87092